MELASAEWLQWPAMVITVVATYLVASTNVWKRNLSFWCYLTGNVLWIAWGVHDGAPALIALQIVLAMLNIRGVLKTE
jgi:hypothetical protein